MYKITKKDYIYKSYRIGWFRFVFCKFGKKFCIRIEVARGWN